MDRLDRKILRLLQEDSTLAVADLAKKVGLSTHTLLAPDSEDGRGWRDPWPRGAAGSGQGQLPR